MARALSVFTMGSCGLPLVSATVVEEAATFVKINPGLVMSAATLAVTVYVPATEFALNTAAVATP